MTATLTDPPVRVCSFADLADAGVKVVSAHGRRIAVFLDGERVHALDNRCPHMGFPLHRGTVRDGVLTCHWHHANFDLASGCTFNLFTDDAVAFPVEVRGADVWVGPRPPDADPAAHALRRLDDGLQHNVSLVLAKAALSLHALELTREAVTRSSLFALRNRAAGWSTGLSILTAVVNVLPVLDVEDRPLAVFHGLVHLASSTAGQRPSFPLSPLPTSDERATSYGRWFREFVEVRQAVAAERTLVSAVEASLGSDALIEMIAGACTDHLYVDSGHTLDFASKALELLDTIGWEHAAEVLASLVPGLAAGRRMEESSSWRRPVDIAALVQAAAGELLALRVEKPAEQAGWDGHRDLAELVLDAEPVDILAEIVRLAADGVPLIELSSAVAYAAARRALHFSVTNENSDWETVHHAFTYANAVDQVLRRVPSMLLARGILDAAMAVSLERFLNIPRRAISVADGGSPPAAEILTSFDVHGNVDECARLVANALSHGRQAEVVRLLGRVLLREDFGFHQYQMYEAGVRQWGRLRDRSLGDHVLLGVTRYLAAHSPTTRARAHAFDVAARLQRGEELHTEAQ